MRRFVLHRQFYGRAIGAGVVVLGLLALVRAACPPGGACMQGSWTGALVSSTSQVQPFVKDEIEAEYRDLVTNQTEPPLEEMQAFMDDCSNVEDTLASVQNCQLTYTETIKAQELVASGIPMGELTLLDAGVMYAAPYAYAWVMKAGKFVMQACTWNVSSLACFDYGFDTRHWTETESDDYYKKDSWQQVMTGITPQLVETWEANTAVEQILKGNPTLADIESLKTDYPGAATMTTLSVVELFLDPPVCGNWHIDSHEGCEDGSATDGDGCSKICKRDALACNENPGFELGTLKGYGANSVDLVSQSWVGHHMADGLYAVDLNALTAGTLWFTINTTSREPFDLTFSLSGNPMEYDPAAPANALSCDWTTVEQEENTGYAGNQRCKRLRVSARWGEQILATAEQVFDVGTVGTNAQNSLNWTPYTLHVVPVSDATTITFESLKDTAYGPFLDMIEVSTVPNCSAVSPTT